ncbi:hypothetical protein BJ508DRAFT_326812 [Ascobolus immersus RN42]|uniref:Uncharacterized protein n=1 Tax=Ascobolus immersus RN42 TaxID=1160509 RepID=A0A3N4IH35_ASCIM|nr:hypothetical protein BJ508DRAFT_326812 [Ascobolus immersus RN42]
MQTYTPLFSPSPLHHHSFSLLLMSLHDEENTLQTAAFNFNTHSAMTTPVRPSSLFSSTTPHQPFTGTPFTASQDDDDEPLDMAEDIPINPALHPSNVIIGSVDHTAVEHLNAYRATFIIPNAARNKQTYLDLFKHFPNFNRLMGIDPFATAPPRTTTIQQLQDAAAEYLRVHADPLSLWDNQALHAAGYWKCPGNAWVDLTDKPFFFAFVYGEIPALKVPSLKRPGSSLGPGSIKAIKRTSADAASTSQSQLTADLQTQQLKYQAMQELHTKILDSNNRLMEAHKRIHDQNDTLISQANALIAANNELTAQNTLLTTQITQQNKERDEAHQALVARLSVVETSAQQEPSMTAIVDAIIPRSNEVFQPAALARIAKALAIYDPFVSTVAGKMVALSLLNDSIYQQLCDRFDVDSQQLIVQALTNKAKDPEIQTQIGTLLAPKIRSETDDTFQHFYEHDFLPNLQRELAKYLDNTSSPAVIEGISYALSDNWNDFLEAIQPRFDQIAREHLASVSGSQYQAPNHYEQPPQYNQAGTAQAPTGYPTSHPTAPEPISAGAAAAQLAALQYGSRSDKIVQFFRENTGLDYRRVPESSAIQLVNPADGLPYEVPRIQIVAAGRTLKDYEFGSGPYAHLPHVRQPAPKGIEMKANGMNYEPIVPPGHPGPKPSSLPESFGKPITLPTSSTTVPSQTNPAYPPPTTTTNQYPPQPTSQPYGPTFHTPSQFPPQLAQHPPQSTASYGSGNPVHGPFTNLTTQAHMARGPAVNTSYASQGPTSSTYPNPTATLPPLTRRQ